MSDVEYVYPRSGLSVSPMKLAYRGVLIERPCANCDTVNIHFEGKCGSGPCAFVRHISDRGVFSDIVCGKPKYQGSAKALYVHNNYEDHDWVAPTYYPADFEAEHFERAREPHSWGYIRSGAEKAFDKILDCVRHFGEPELYTSDLFRDYQKLVSEPRPSRFVWAIRANGCGTDLFTPEIGISGYYTDNPHMAYFLYDGLTHGPLGEFVECNLATARTVLSVWRAAELYPVQVPT